MKLSVLDQAPVTKGNTSEDALQKAIELAVTAEQLGYERIWLAEHHNTVSFASSAPEVTSAYIAAKTDRIRVGTGGTMIMHYAPYKLAEIFKTLSALAPGRIDFGAGRAPGGDNKAIYALADGRPPHLNDQYNKLDTALKLINDEEPESQLYKGMVASPHHIQLPEAWLLGSSGNSAMEAGVRGLGYSYAQFFTGEMPKYVLDTYRNNFVPSPFMPESRIIVSYFVTVAETADEAEYEALPADIARLQLIQGRLAPYMSPEEAKDYPLTEMDRMLIQENRKLHFVGTPAAVAERLQQEQQQYGFDEAMICSIPHSQAKRLDVYRLLARELIS